MNSSRVTYIGGATLDFGSIKFMKIRFGRFLRIQNCPIIIAGNSPEVFSIIGIADIWLLEGKYSMILF